MTQIPLLFGKNHCYYIETYIFDQKERFLIDTGFSSYLCLSSKLKNLFPQIHTFISFDTEFILADSSKKKFKQYSIPLLSIFLKSFSNIPVTFNDDESIIGVKMLEKLESELRMNFREKKGVLRITGQGQE